MRYISLFSGIEAASVAFEPLGFEPVAFAEIEPFPCAVLAHRFPDVPNLGDVTQIDWEEVIKQHGPVDLVCGGSPCQSFSIAGGREGLDGESRLMYEYIRAVQDIRPMWFLWENVPGVFSVDRGRAFAILLDEMDKLGYGMAWRTLDAQFFGVAQRRRRVFLVGCLAGAGCSAAVLFDRQSVSGNTQSSKQKRKELAAAAESRAGGSYTLKLRHTGSDNRGGGQGPLVQDDVSATLATGQDQTLFCIQGAGDTSTGANGSGYTDTGECYTLNTIDVHAVSTLAFDESQITSKQNGNNPKWNEACHTLHLNADRAHVVCMADDTQNAAIDEELCGSLKVGGYSIRDLNAEIVGALCARESHGLGMYDAESGKVIICSAVSNTSRELKQAE